MSFLDHCIFNSGLYCRCESTRFGPLPGPRILLSRRPKNLKTHQGQWQKQQCMYNYNSCVLNFDFAKISEHWVRKVCLSGACAGHRKVKKIVFWDDAGENMLGNSRQIGSERKDVTGLGWRVTRPLPPPHPPHLPIRRDEQNFAEQTT